MDHTRVHRIGNRPYYRTNFMPNSNTRQTIEERLHARGISTSSNSSWTFSNSHSDVPKPRKGRMCGIFLVGAVFIVIVAVLCIGGLAFYMGALRLESGKQELIFDGSLRITYGDQYQSNLSNDSSAVFQERANKYAQLLTNVYRKSVIGPSLLDVTISKFENGSLVVHFRISLDRRKIPSSVTTIEDTLQRILTEEISSVKPVAFRNLQVDRQALFIKRYLGDEISTSEYQSSETKEKPQNSVEVKNGVIRKVPSTTTDIPSKDDVESKTVASIQGQGTIIPEGAILGISETMQNFTESLKIKPKVNYKIKETTTEMDEIMEMDESDIKSIEFNEDVPPNATNKVYQSVYITSDNVVIKNNTARPVKDDSVIEGSYKITKSDGDLIENQKLSEKSKNSASFNGHARPHNAEAVVNASTEVPSSSTLEIIVPDYEEEPWRPIIPSEEQPVEPKEAYIDVYDAIISEEDLPPMETKVNASQSIVLDVVDDKSPITFSKETYEQNIKVAPEFNGPGSKIKYQNVKNNKLSRITDDLAKKYKDLLKNHRIVDEESDTGVAEVLTPEEIKVDYKKTTPSEIFLTGENTPGYPLVATAAGVTDRQYFPLGLDQMISGISQVGTAIEPEEEVDEEDEDESAGEESTTLSNGIAQEVSIIPSASTQSQNSSEEIPSPANATVKNPFLETDDSRSSSVYTFGIPDLPILKQFHHLDSLLKSFSKTSEKSNKSTQMNVKTVTANTTEAPGPIFNLTTVTRFPARTKTTTDKNFRNEDKVYIEISTISPESSTRIGIPSPIHRTTKPKPRTTTAMPITTTTTTAATTTTTTTTKRTTTTTQRAATTSSKPIVIKGEVEVLDVPAKTENITFDRIQPITTTEVPKLITLLPVRSNVNMKRPLRPRPKATEENPTTEIAENRKQRSSKMSVEFKAKPKFVSRYRFNKTESQPKVLYSIPYQQHQFVDDKDGKRWVYYSSSKQITPNAATNEKLFIVTPEPKTTINYTNNGDFSDSDIKEIDEELVKLPDIPVKQKIPQGNVTKMPLYNAIESLLNTDFRKREEGLMKEKNSSLPEMGETEPVTNNTSEIVDKIVKIMENVAISTGNSTKLILKVNQTIINETEASSQRDSASNSTDIGISTKAVSSNYKLNQAGVPVLTKVLNKDPNYYKKNENASSHRNFLNESVIYSHISTECDNTSITCGNGVCLPMSSRCNQLVDCPDAADEKNCTCSEHLKAQHLHRKLCDGVVDCWDFTDEFDCEWCKEKQYLCLNSRMCIDQSQICDGTNHCPFGDDERDCVTVSPSKDDANSFNYHTNGYLMVRKHGKWGKLCIDNFENVSQRSNTGWKISDLGRSVCKALTFKDFDKVERMISVPNEGRALTLGEPERYYELSYNDVSNIPDSYMPNSILTFHETECSKKEVVKVTCTDLECGLRPQATNQWSSTSRHSRIVGGGNASPGAWPWQAALYKEGEFQCGATLISAQWLVSAGHCFYHNQDEYWVARLGTLRTTSSLPSPYEQLRQISRILLHPQYIDTGFINDISLLKMADPVVFTDYVRPICLPKPSAKIVDGTMCTVVGWGQLFEIGRIFPDTLQEVQLPILSSSECRKRTVFLPLYKITDDMFCAGFDRGGRDACLGDSGGPLMCQDFDGKWSLYGVTSNGYGCARSNRPGVYTKVSRYLHWMQAQMNLPTYFLKNAQSQGTQKDKCKGHRCPLGECLPTSRLCNGYVECSDGSDEKDCW